MLALGRRAFLAVPAALILPAEAAPAGASDRLRRIINGEPLSIDPHAVFDEAGGALTYDLCEGLISFSADGRTIPGVAESWSVSADGRTCVFTLRAAARWSDGRPLLANDFVFSWRRLADPKTAAQFASMLDAVENAPSVIRGDMPPERLGVSARDERTFEVRLTEPTAYFLKQVAHYSLVPVPEHVVSSAPGRWTEAGVLVSNGAFRLRDRRRGQYLRLERNPHFHDAGSVRLTEIDYLPSGDRQLDVMRYRAGEADVTYSSPSSQIGWLQDRLGAAQRLTGRLAVNFLTVNLDHPPLQDRSVRQALMMTVERDILAGRIVRGGEKATYGMVPSALWSQAGYRPRWAGEGRRLREESARRMMEEAGYSGSRPLILDVLYDTSEDNKRVLVAVSAMWKAIHVRTRLINVEPRAMNDYRRKRAFHLARTTWVADYDHPYNFLELFRSDAGPLNFPNYRNDVFDDLLRRARSAPPPAAERLYANAERLLMNDAPVLPLFIDASRQLVRTDLEGWRDNPMNVHLGRWMSFSQTAPSGA